MPVRHRTSEHISSQTKVCNSCLCWAPQQALCSLQVEIVRFRTDAKSVGDVIIERAATLGAAAVVRKALSIPF